MSGSDTVLPKEVVNVLINEPILIREWKEFYGFLDLPKRELPQLDTSYLFGTLKVYDLFLRIIQDWISKSGTTATLGVLFQILRENGFNHATGQLVHKFAADLDGKSDEKIIFRLSRLKISPVLKTMVNSDSKSSPNVKQTPIWYNMTTPNQNDQKREAELKSLHKYFKERTSPTLKVILISGERLIGKSELTRYFVSDLHENQSVSCIWIDGDKVEPQMTHFLASLHTNLNDLSQTLIDKGWYPWVIIFDGILDDNISHVKKVLDNFRKYPPSQQPFVIITTRMDNIEELKYTLFSNRNFDVIKFPRWLGVVDKMGLKNFMQNYVTPYVLEKGDGDQSFKEIWTKVHKAFELADADPGLFRKKGWLPWVVKSASYTEMSTFIRNSTLCLIKVLSSHLTDTVHIHFLISLFKTVLKLANEGYIDILLHVIDSFVKAGVISKNSRDEIKMPKEEINSVLKMYLEHPGIKSITSDLFDKTELSAIISLMQSYHNFIKLKNGSCVVILNVESFLIEVTKHDILIQDFKMDINQIFIGLKEMSVEVAKSVYNSYVRLFGDADEGSSKAALRLANFFSNSDNIWKQSGEMWELLHKIKKVKYGNVDQRTLKAGGEAAKAFRIERMHLEEIKIRREMAQNCENELGPTKEKTMRNKYQLAYALKIGGKLEDALDIYKEILPMYIHSRGPRGYLTNRVKAQISEITNILSSKCRK